MSEPIKDNEAIRGDDCAFRDAVRRARAQLGGIKGVIGVGFGAKETKGLFTDDIAILVYVARKERDEDLAPAQRIPPTFDGYRTDVRVSLPSRRSGSGCQDATAYPTITGGIQIEAHGAYPPTASAFLGTLGCIVQRRGDTGDNNVYLLTNEHVLLHDGGTRAGDGVYHPYFPRTDPVDTNGTLLGKIDSALVHDGHVDDHGRPVADEPNDDPPEFAELIDPDFDGTFVDCAAVRIDLGSFCCGSACTRNDIKFATTIPGLNSPPAAGLAPTDVDRIVDVRDLRGETVADVVGMRVVKNGKSSARTVGRITGIGPDHNTVLPLGETHARVISLHYNVIQIVLDDPPPAVNPCSGENDFIVDGDSGSLVVDEQNRAVGLIYSGSMVGSSAGVLNTQACLIVPVLDRLGMCIPTTTGTSHGSSLATDGSGLVAFAADPDLSGDDDDVLFTSHNIAAQRAAPRSPLAEPATDEERARMQPLLDALLETERGRELYEAFSQLSREIANLVRRNRQTKVAWHRSQGPAYLACVLNHLKGEAETVPREICGVARTALLQRMSQVLYRHGSNPLREAIDRHRDDVMRMADADSATECFELMRRAEEKVTA